MYDYEYDLEGNRTAKETIANGEREEYEYDYRNRLTQVTFKDQYDTVVKSVAYSYDLFNRQTRRVYDADGPGGSAATDQFFIQDGGNISLEFDGTAAGDVAHHYLWGPDRNQFLADEPIVNTSTPGTTQWALTDPMGSPTDLITQSGGGGASFVGEDAYSLVGERMSHSGEDTIAGYGGQPTDSATSLVANGIDYYDPNHGSNTNTDDGTTFLTTLQIPPRELHSTDGETKRDWRGSVKVDGTPSPVYPSANFKIEYRDADGTIYDSVDASGRDVSTIPNYVPRRGIMFFIPEKCNFLQFWKSTYYDKNDNVVPNPIIFIGHTGNSPATYHRPGQWYLDTTPVGQGPGQVPKPNGAFYDVGVGFLQSGNHHVVTDAPSDAGPFLNNPTVERIVTEFRSYVVCDGKIMGGWKWTFTSLRNATADHRPFAVSPWDPNLRLEQNELTDAFWVVGFSDASLSSPRYYSEANPFLGQNPYNPLVVGP